MQSVILGPSEELGLNFYQGITTTQNDEKEASDEESGKRGADREACDVVRVAPAARHPPPPRPPPPVLRQREMEVNLEAWDQFLEQAYVDQHSYDEEEAMDGSDYRVTQLKDSGIARPSFSGSVDILGSSFDSDVRQVVDDLSVVAHMWNEELAAALAVDSQLNSVDGNASYCTDADDVKDVSQISEADDSPDGAGAAAAARPDATYFSYDKIDEDIQQQQANLSTIREERESVSSTELSGTPDATGRTLLAQLQRRSQMQRSADAWSDSHDSSDDDDDQDDQEQVLVVDLESKRAVLVEAQSAQLKVAIETQDYQAIFDEDSSPYGASRVTFIDLSLSLL